MYYFSSDHHFGDPRTIISRYRPFSSLEEMNEGLVRIWNEIVTPDDVVYYLGDSAVNDEALLEFIPRLNGRKRLVFGNYEVTLPRESLELVFDEIHEDPISLWIGGHRLHLAHYPLQRNDDADWNLCGHIHDLWKVTKNMMNVGVDAWHFRPVSEEIVYECMRKQQSGNWDANVYPDADLDWQVEVTGRRNRPDWEPTKEILAEKQREAEETARERTRREWTR